MIPALLLTHRRAMHKFATKLTRDATRAEDILQDACVSALRTPTSPTINPRAWLNGHVLTAFRNMNKRESRYVEGGDEIAALETVDAGQPYAHALREIAATVANLPPQQRQAFDLVAVQGYSQREAARKLGYADNRGLAYHLRPAMAAVEQWRDAA